jgi:hypothetical protein
MASLFFFSCLGVGGHRDDNDNKNNNNNNLDEKETQT